jgi:hypothetical protein
MIPFKNSWPYEKVMGDIYITACPFCEEENVITTLKDKDLKAAQKGTRKILVMPCCHGTIKIIDADNDYLLSDKPLRR